MTFIITEDCCGTCDTSCVDVCPVDCIHGPIDTEEIRDIREAGDMEKLEDVQLYIDPFICIDCGACVPECPVEAIFDEFDLPEEHEHSLEENAEFFE